MLSKKAKERLKEIERYEREQDELATELKIAEFGHCPICDSEKVHKTIAGKYCRNCGWGVRYDGFDQEYYRFK